MPLFRQLAGRAETSGGLHAGVEAFAHWGAGRLGCRHRPSGLSANGGASAVSLHRIEYGRMKGL